LSWVLKDEQGLPEREELIKMFWMEGREAQRRVKPRNIREL
jgi:hypothetical protein